MDYCMYIVGGQCKELAFAAQAAALRRHKPALLLDSDLAEQVRPHCAPRPRDAANHADLVVVVV